MTEHGRYLAPAVEAPEANLVPGHPHGLKFADQKTAYHVGTRPGVHPTRQNRPVELAPDPRRVADAVARHVERARLLVG